MRQQRGGGGLSRGPKRGSSEARKDARQPSPADGGDWRGKLGRLPGSDVSRNRVFSDPGLAELLRPIPDELLPRVHAGRGDWVVTDHPPDPEKEGERGGASLPGTSPPLVTKRLGEWQGHGSDLGGNQLRATTDLRAILLRAISPSPTAAH